jgi:carbonic anhydrase
VKEVNSMWPWRFNFHNPRERNTCLLIGCSDAPERLPGEPLAGWSEVTRVTSFGNVVPTHEASPQPIAAILAHAATQRGVCDVVVCGHRRCEALRGLLLPAELAPTEAHRTWSAHAAPTRALLRKHYMHLEAEALWEVAVQEHVLAQMENLLTHPALRSAVKGSVGGWLMAGMLSHRVVYSQVVER